METQYRFLLSFFILSAWSCVDQAGSPPFSNADPLLADPQPSLAAISGAAMDRIQDGVGKAREALFFGSGEFVVVLDHYEPFLRLFSRSGVPLWSGGKEGEGPQEFESPQAIAVEDDRLFVLQAGKVSEWAFDGDSLAFREVAPIPLHLFPLGAEIGCNGDLLIYARNEEGVFASQEGRDPSRQVAYLHSWSFPFGSNQIRPFWHTERDPYASPFLGHVARLFSRNGRRLVIHHRVDYRVAGEFIELDCRGTTATTLLKETELVEPDSFPVIAPRPRALEWTAGTVATPEGFITLQQRYYSKRLFGNKAMPWKTEVFFLLGEGGVRSVLIPGQWYLMDIDSTGDLLLATEEPIPHFVTVHQSALLRAGETSGSP